MSCLDDPARLSDKTVAMRAADLCRVAEATALAHRRSADLLYVASTLIDRRTNMQKPLDIDMELLAAENGYWTAREISEQPDAWVRTHAAVDRQRKRIEDWLGPGRAIQGGRGWRMR